MFNMFRKPKPNPFSPLKPDPIAVNCTNPLTYVECARKYKPRNYVSDVPESNVIDNEHRALVQKISMEKDENLKNVLYKLDRIQKAFIIHKGRSSAIRASSNEEQLTVMRDTFVKLKERLDNLNIVGKVSDLTGIHDRTVELRPDIEADKVTEIAKINMEIRLIDDALATIYAQRKPLGGRKTKRKRTKKTKRR